MNEMAEWPINITEAAHRLGIPKSTASLLVVGADIPTRRMGHSYLIDSAGFEMLRVAAERLRKRPKSLERRKAAAHV